MFRVPDEVAERRREADAKLMQHVAIARVSAKTLHLAAWTLLLTDVPPNQLTRPVALVLLRERWQIEPLFKRWKQEGHLDEWRTSSFWRILCEIYAKLIGLLLQHWLFLLFARAVNPNGAWSNCHRSYVRPPMFCWKHWLVTVPFGGLSEPLSVACVLARR